MAAGPQIDGFEDLTLLGRGASGTVYRGHQSEMNRAVAIKVLSATTTDPHARERFQREVRTLGELSGHPNIVTVYTSGTTEEDQPYLVMGLMESDITGLVPVDEATAIDYIRQVARGLAVAHDAGVLHRDIKPANIFLDRYDTIRLGDFGLVGLSDTATMTQSSVGSPAYMAPELLGNSRASRASDIYALGVTLYELVEGALPFRMGAGGVAGLLHTILTAPPEPMRATSPGLDRFLQRCLAKEPAERPQTVAEFLDGLDRAEDPLASLPPPTVQPPVAPPDPRSTRTDSGLMPGVSSGDPAVTSGPTAWTASDPSAWASSVGQGAGAAAFSGGGGVGSGDHWHTASGGSPPPGAVATKRRWPWMVGVLVVIAALAAGGVVYFTGGDDGEPPLETAGVPESGVFRLSGVVERTDADGETVEVQQRSSLFLIDADNGYLVGDSYGTVLENDEVLASDGAELDLDLVGVSECHSLAVYETDPATVEGRFEFRWANGSLDIGDPAEVHGFDAEDRYQNDSVEVVAEAHPSNLNFASLPQQVDLGGQVPVPTFGGPVLDDDGEVAAVVFNNVAPDTIQAVDVSLAEDVVDEIIALERSISGIGIQPESDVDGGGIRVLGVGSDSPAEGVGLLPGDVITSIDGVAFSDGASIIDRYCEATTRNQALTIPIEVRRDGQRMVGELDNGSTGTPLAPVDDDPSTTTTTEAPPADIPDLEPLFSFDSSLLIDLPADWSADDAPDGFPSAVLVASGDTGTAELSHQLQRPPSAVLDDLPANLPEACTFEERSGRDVLLYEGIEQAFECNGTPGMAFAGTDNDGATISLVLLYDGPGGVAALYEAILPSMFYSDL